MKTILSLSVVAVLFAVGAMPVQAQYGYDGYARFHDELSHRAYHRAHAHAEAHRYPMTKRQHERLHDALDHEAYHDELEHRAYHRGLKQGAASGHSHHGHQHYHSGGYGVGRYYQPSYGPTYTHGSLRLSYPSAGFYLRYGR